MGTIIFIMRLMKVIYLRGSVRMKKDSKGSNEFFYDDEGTNLISKQIMNAYNGGVVDHIDGQFDMSSFTTDEELKE